MRDFMVQIDGKAIMALVSVETRRGVLNGSYKVDKASVFILSCQPLVLPR